MAGAVRFLRRLVASALAALLAGVAALVVGAVVPRPLVAQAPEQSEARHRILVLMNPIHTDIAIPLEPEVIEAFAFLRGQGQPIDAPGARYLVIGWGGRDFYTKTPTWSDLKLVPLLRGLTLDRAVMHVDVAGDIPEPHPEVVGFDVGNDRFAAMLSRIQASFTRNASGPVPIPGVSYGQYDAFYEGEGNFSAILGCNTWSASVLRAGGLRTGWWNPLPLSLTQSLSWFN